MAGTVARPKVYIDYISYFRATGLGVDTNFGNSNINEDYSDIAIYNPSNTKTFTPVQENNFTNTEGVNLTNMYFRVGLGDGASEQKKLISSMNWAGMFNHNYNSIDYQFGSVNMASQTGVGGGLGSGTFYGGGKNNIRLWSFDENNWTDDTTYGVVLIIGTHSQATPFKLGSFVTGRSFTFPHNANLSMNINNETNIRKTRTLGGSDIVDINYYRQPLWNGYPPFVATNEPSLSATSSIGRRSWALTFSFLTQDSTFPQDMGEGFMFDNNITDDGVNTWTNWTTENITSHFMTLTLNGQLPFLFQPDDTKDVYAWCRLKSNTFSVQQSAPNLYTSKMTFEEVW